MCNMYLSQGEKGLTGEPGPRGPYGLPVSLFKFFFFLSNPVNNSNNNTNAALNNRLN